MLFFVGQSSIGVRLSSPSLPGKGLCYNFFTMLTPIRVRGKRTRDTITPNGTPSMATQQRKAPKLTEEPIVTEPVPPTKALSRLETLPVELIEKIFLDCLEMNLPRASPYVASALSSERIYRLLILISFWDNDPEAQVPNYKAPNEISKMFLPIAYQPLDTAERRALQTAILNCRWCTQDRIERQAPALLYLNVQSIWFTSDNVMEENDKAKLERIIWEGTESATFKGRHDGHEAELHIQPPFVLKIFDLASQFISRYWVVGVLHFPTKLLHGMPWTDEKLSFLEFLIKAYGHDLLGWKTRASPSHAIQEGIHNAIVEQNPRALRALLMLDELESREECRRNNITLYQLPAEHFRTAVRHCGDNSEFLKILVRGSAESVPYDDPEVTEWATEAQERGDPFGKWLLDLMLRLPGESLIGDVAIRLNMFNQGKPMEGPAARYMPHGGCDPPTLASIFGQRLDYWRNELP